MRDRYSPSDTRSFAFLPSAFCFPCPSLGQPARTLSKPESGSIVHSERAYDRKSACLSVCGGCGLAAPIMPITSHWSLAWPRPSCGLPQCWPRGHPSLPKAFMAGIEVTLKSYDLREEFAQPQGFEPAGC